MDIQMRYVYSLLIALLLFGCGNASEPSLPKKEEIKKEQVTLHKKDETNSTITHIRVLAEDTKSKIPEYLLKLPIQTK